MAGYTVIALSLDQQRNASHAIVAVSVTDSTGQPVNNLDRSSFVARDITTGASIAISELHSTGVRGFYRLSLQTQSGGNAKEFIVALVVAGRHQEAGRIPQPVNEGQTIVKVRMVEG